MAKVYVLPVAGREAEVNTIRGLIEAAGCEIVCEDTPIDMFESCIAAADVVVILICAETVGEKIVADAIRAANAGGKRIVGVWSAVPGVDAPPEDLEKLGDAILAWTPDKLGPLICEGEVLWQTSGGGQRPPPKTPRHKC